MKILSIDPASSSGIALLEDNKLVVTNLLAPQFWDMYRVMCEQDWLKNTDVVLIEEFVYFGNGKRTKKQNPLTTRQVIKRIGFLEGILNHMKYDVRMMHVASVRKQIGIKGAASEAKQKVNSHLRNLTHTILTTDISDAIAQLLAHLGHDNLNAIEQYDFQRLKNIKA